MVACMQTAWLIKKDPGLWIFGWNRLSPRLHLATIWLAALGTSMSAYFILAANSWMRHPVGYYQRLWLASPQDS